MESSKQQNQTSSVKIPSHISPPAHQLSGHVFGKGANKLGILKDDKTSRLLKPFMDTRGPREYEFYLKIWSSSEYKALQQFIPKLFGLVTIDRVDFIELEDVTDGLHNPSNMDVKIGLITYDPFADFEKIKKETAKSKCSAAHGFRICGMRIYNSELNGCVVVDKSMCHQLVPSSVGDMLDLFLGARHLQPSERVQLIEAFLNKLQCLRNWFIMDNVHKLEFYSSSLLFVYSTHESCVKVRLKMIDFAHVYQNTHINSGKPHDVNYLYGLDKLIEYFTFFRNQILSKDF